MNKAESPPLIISEPQKNPEVYYTRFFLTEPVMVEMLFKNFEHNHITPQTHPQVLELFAGDAPITHLLAQKGWKNFTCMDMYKSFGPPLFPDSTTWIYIDLKQLAHCIEKKDEPGEIKSLQHQFNIVTATFAIPYSCRRNIYCSPEEIKILTSYFAAEHAFIEI